MLICQACGREMVPLFVTAVCPWCEQRGPFDLDAGWVVWRGHDADRGYYVFHTRGDALRWREANGLEEHPVVRVRCESPFIWRKSAGGLADLSFADRLYEVFPDHRFPRGPGRAFVDPDQPESGPEPPRA